jgi:hypothetical protein
MAANEYCKLRVSSFAWRFGTGNAVEILIRSSYSIMRVFSSFGHGVAFVCLAAVCLAPGPTAYGASSSLTPAAISNTYSGYFTLQIGGLTNGEPAIVENYLDVNNNGVVDAADMLMASYRITDGQRALIGGATNVCVPGDFTGTDGSITTYLPYLSNTPQHGMGRHLFCVSSPSSNFSSLTNSLIITNWPFPQSITGTITSASTNVPFAVVVILTASPNGQGELVGEVVADSNGAYSARLPVGDYQLLAFKPGYVFSAANAPQVSLTNGASMPAPLTLLPATQPFGGRVVNAANTNGPLRGLFMIIQSASGLIAIGSTDANGYFNVPIVPDAWEVTTDSTSLAPLGYLDTQSKPGFDTTVTIVTNALITYIKGTAMIYGTILNLSGAPQGGISFWGNNNSNTMESSGWSDPAGNYSVVTTSGTWWAGPDSQALGGNAIVGGTGQFPMADGLAVRQDLVIVQATTVIHGSVKNTQGQPVGGVDMWCNAQQNGVNFNSSAQTDANGNYVLGAFDGNWTVGFSCSGNSGLDSFGYQCPYRNSILSIPPANPVLDFILYPIGTPQLGPPFLTGTTQAALALYGQPGTNYIVQYSTNLSDPLGWRTVTTLHATNMVTTVWDNNATNLSRFYRARIWP